jgi:hypothetical protein
MADDRDAGVLVWIADRVAGSHPITSTELQEHVTLDYDFPVRRACVNSFIGRHSSAFSQVKSSPQEAEGFQIPRSFLYETLSCLTRFGQGLPTELAFDLVPVAISD